MAKWLYKQTGKSFTVQYVPSWWEFRRRWRERKARSRFSYSGEQINSFDNADTMGVLLKHMLGDQPYDGPYTHTG